MRKWNIVTRSILCIGIFISTYNPIFAQGEPNTLRMHFEKYSYYDYLNGKNWSYCQLKSEDGTEISLDYQICPFSWRYPSAYYARTLNRDVTAPQIWFNVKNKNFTGNEEVKVVFIRKYINKKWTYSGYNWTLQEDVSHFHLTPVSGEHKFTVRLENTFITPLVDYNLVNEPNWQEVAIEVDGKWLQDPISKTHNFKVDLLYPFKQYKAG